MRQSKAFVADPFEYHQEIEVDIDSLTNLGIGLGRYDNWVVMVPFALPGERVLVRVFRNHKNYSEADLVKVLKPSPDRIEPQCKLFGECGGCQYQHLAYEAQLEWKRKQVEDLFERIGGVTIKVQPTIGSPKQYHYRSKLTPHFPHNKDEGFPIGFLKSGQRRALIDVPQCPIATEKINAAMLAARDEIRAYPKRYKKGGTLLLRDTLEGVQTDNKAIVSERMGKFVFQFPAGDFFQNNPFILPKLVEVVLAGAQAEAVRYLIDAYCGVGMFAIAGSEHFEKVLGVEVNAQAVKAAHNNARLNNLENVDFIVGNAETIFNEVDFPGEQTAVIIDPPRKGCDEVFIKQLVDFGPKRIVYVSCGPDTQARDVAMLIAAGYTLDAVQPFDLFPQTRHIENVTLLSKA